MLDCADGEVTMTENLSCSARFDTEAIFSDGFETGGTSEWSSTTGGT